MITIANERDLGRNARSLKEAPPLERRSPELMKAILQDRYGDEDVLRVGERPIPVPGEDEVLVRVIAASMHPDVWHVTSGLPYVLRVMGAGFMRPTNPVPGTDLAGIVEAVGARVTQFHPGDAVFGETIRGMQWINGGAYAEYACAPEDSLAHKPAHVSFEAAASVPTAGLIAIANLELTAHFASGARVLVNGAGGGVGAFAVQILKARGAHVTAVDHGDKLQFLRSVGADETIDFTREDFTLRTDGFAFLLDVATNRSFDEYRRVLAPDGVYVAVGHDHFGAGMSRVFGLIPRLLGLALRSLFTPQLPRPNGTLPDKAKSLDLLRRLLDEGALTPHVDRVFPLEETALALRALKEGKTRGKIVIRVAPDP